MNRSVNNINRVSDRQLARSLEFVRKFDPIYTKVVTSVVA